MVILGSRRGMSLIEAVCALLVVYTAAAGLLVANLRHFQTIGDSFDQLSAQRAAAAVLESHIADERPCELGRRGLPAEALPALPAAQLSELVEQVEPGLLRVTVTVAWESAGRPRSLQLETLLAREDSE